MPSSLRILECGISHYGCRILCQPSYSLDLAPYDFYHGAQKCQTHISKNEKSKTRISISVFTPSKPPFFYILYSYTPPPPISKCRACLFVYMIMPGVLGKFSMTLSNFPEISPQILWSGSLCPPPSTSLPLATLLLLRSPVDCCDMLRKVKMHLKIEQH